MEIKDLTGGLVLNVSPDALAKNQLQAAENVTVTDTPGVVKTRKGRTALNDIVYTGATDIYYQNVLSTPSIVVVGDCILLNLGTLKGVWVDEQLLGVRLQVKTSDEDAPPTSTGGSADYATGYTDFDEYNSNLVFCDGNRNYRLADDMGCTLFVVQSALWEYDDSVGFLSALFDAPTDYTNMVGVPFILATTGDITTSQYWCCFVWEKQQILGESTTAGKMLAPLAVDFNVLTTTYSASSLGLTADSLKTKVNYLMLPCEIGNIVPGPPFPSLGAAGNPNGTYTYKVTFVNQDGFESNGSEATISVSPSSQKVTISYVDRSYRRDGAKRRIYRIENGGATWKRVGEIADNDQTTFIDDVADVDLGVAIPEVNAAPPGFAAIKEHRSLLYGVRTYKPEEVWYCNDRSEWHYFDSLNYEIFGSNPSNSYALVSLGPYLVVIHDVKAFLLNTRDVPNTTEQALIQEGAANAKAVFDVGDGVLLGSPSSVLYFNGVTAIDITKVVKTLFTPFDATTTCTSAIDCGSGETCINGRCVSSNNDTLNPLYIDNMRIACAANDILISYTRIGQSTNDRTLWIKKDTGVVEGIITEGFIDLCVDKKTKSIYGLKSDYRVYRLLYGGDDEGTDISWHFQTKDFAVEFESIVSAKQGIKAKIDCDPNGGTITVKVYMDGSLVQTRTITGSSRSTTRWGLPDRTFHRISYKISGSGLQYFYGLSDNITEGGI